MADDAPEEATESTDAATTDDAIEAEAPAPALGELATRTLARFEAEFGDALVEHGAMAGDLVVRIRPDAWLRAGSSATAA